MTVEEAKLTFLIKIPWINWTVMADLPTPPEPITTIGAIIGEIPVVAGLNENPTIAIANGDFIEVDADIGKVEITKRR